MIIDYLAVLGDAQVLTVTAASTNIMDTVAAGDAIGAHSWLQVLVDTTFVGQGATTLVVALETATDAAFTSPVVLAQSAAITEGDAKLSAGGIPFQIQIPIGALEFLRVKYTVGSGPFTAGKIDARILSDIDRTLDKIL